MPDVQRLAAVTAGTNGWTTTGDAELEVPELVLLDGPMGIASRTFDERETALLVPCGTALAATWNPETVQAVGGVVGQEAVRNGVDGVLGPNLGLPRTPHSGRSFEMFAEDPLLTGVLGAAWIRGVQDQGVAACPKHLVGNDTETQRRAMDAVIDEPTLREVYLVPFEHAVRAGAWMLMTAYNKLNGVPCVAHPDLLRIVREEWGFDGVVVSDWFGVEDGPSSALAGVDLEMPGPAREFGAALVDAVPTERLAEMVDRLRLLGRRTRVPSVDAGVSAKSVLRNAAAESFVLLHNNGDLLPLSDGEELAVLGPNALSPCLQGGTFAQVTPFDPGPSPLEALRDRFSVVHEPGVATADGVPPLTGRTPDGEPGVLLEHLDPDGAVLFSEVRQTTSFVWFGDIPGSGPTQREGRLRLTALVSADADGVHTFLAGGTGEVVLSVDGRELVRSAAPDPGDVMGAVARADTSVGEALLEAGARVRVTAEMVFQPGRVQALNVGCRAPVPADLQERAEAAAAAADTAVLIVGETRASSRESADREHTRLRDDQVELIRRVAHRNPRTVVVVNASYALDMPWADEVGAVLQVWFPGQEFGPALAAVLAGDTEPGGRLPVTVADAGERPRLDDDLRLVYAESEPIGYRRAHKPRFPFGHGLGYTSFELAEPRLDGTTASVTVRNTGRRRGQDVVQYYVGESPVLAGFDKVTLDPGEQRSLRRELPDRALQRWDSGGWRWCPEPVDVWVGRSGADLHHCGRIDASQGRMGP